MIPPTNDEVLAAIGDAVSAEYDRFDGYCVPTGQHDDARAVEKLYAPMVNELREANAALAVFRGDVPNQDYSDLSKDDVMALARRVIAERDALRAEVERLQAESKETRRAALLGVARAVCVGCRVDISTLRARENGYYHYEYHHPDGVTYSCEASEIHALLAQERLQVGGGGK